MISELAEIVKQIQLQVHPLDEVTQGILKAWGGDANAMILGRALLEAAAENDIIDIVKTAQKTSISPQIAAELIAQWTENGAIQHRSVSLISINIEFFGQPFIDGIKGAVDNVAHITRPAANGRPLFDFIRQVWGILPEQVGKQEAIQINKTLKQIKNYMDARCSNKGRLPLTENEMLTVLQAFEFWYYTIKNRWRSERGEPHYQPPPNVIWREWHNFVMYCEKTLNGKLPARPRNWTTPH